MLWVITKLSILSSGIKCTFVLHLCFYFFALKFQKKKKMFKYMFVYIYIYTHTHIHITHIQLNATQPQKEWNNDICSYMDGPRDDHTKQVSQRERQIPCDIT